MGIVWTAIFWLTGIFAGRQFPLLPKHWILLAAITLFAALVLRKYPRHRGIFLLLFVFMLASLRSRLDVKILQPDDLGFYNDLDVPVTITGIVVDDPDRREDATRLRVRAERLVIPALEIARPIQGDVLVRSSKYEHWSYGDWIRVKGNLETPPTLDTFSYEDYLARKDIYSWMPQTTALRLGEQKGNPFLRRLYQMRGALLHTVYRILPDPEASLSAGILLGIESGITDDLYEDFNRTGTTHIIAISGFNITLIANIFIALSRRLFGSRRGLWIAGGGITLYTLLVGADAAVVRAAIMGGLALIARYWGRDTFGLASLGATGLLMTAIDPPVLWDVGFQLSFTATLGLILYSQPLERWSVKLLSGRINPEAAQEMGGVIAELLLCTLAAQMTTWPLTILYFQRFSLIALFVNPLILPLQPPLMILTGAAALLGTIWLPMGRLAALFAWPFPALTIRLVTFFARFADGGLGLSGLSPWFLVGYYIVLIGGSIAIRELQKHNSIWASLEPLIDTLRARAVWLLIAAALVTGIIWQSAARAPDGNLHLTFFDVGAGDAILIESPAGQNILVDGGSSPTLLMNHLGYKLPLLQRKIDWLVIGGTRSNQTAGLLGLSDHLRLEHVLMPPVSGSYSFQRLQNELTDAGINLHLAERGQRLDLGEGASVEVIDCSSAGLILLVRHHNARILLPTGLTPELHPVMNSDHRVRSVSAMLLPDGGHNSVNSPGWLKHTDPTIVIISVDASEGINRPAAEVLDALGERSILRTDRSGTLELHTDGIVLWLESERDPTD